MAKPDLQLVHKTLRERFLSALNDDINRKTQVSYMNVAFTRPSSGIWLRETFQEAGEPELFLFGTLHTAIGLYTIDTFTPDGTGTEEVDTLAHKIANSFAAVHSLSTRGVGVSIDRVSRLPGRKADEVWWMKPVVISWRTYSPATTGTN